MHYRSSNVSSDVDDLLVIDVLPFKHSTRTRKMALTLKSAHPELRVTAVTLNRAGRMGFADDRHTFEEGGVKVRQVEVAPARSSSSVRTMLWNLIIVYPPGLSRLALEVLRRPSAVVMVGSTSLSWLGALHQLRYGSYCLLNARERYAGIRTRGSIGSIVSILERRMTKYMARPDVTLTSVCRGHADEFRAVGARDVRVIRNLPRLDFAERGYVPPPETSPFIVVIVGSLYPGRGLEALIAAVSILASEGADISLEITGMGGADYIEKLRQLARSLEGGEAIVFLGSCEPSEVASRYHRGHLGTALYEPVDLANDSLSNKLFESVASGRPVLASSLSENVRAIEDEGIGWTCDVTRDAIAQALQRIMSDREGVVELGRHCYDQYRERLNWEHEASELGPLVLSHVADHSIEEK